MCLLSAKRTIADPESTSRDGAFRGRIMADFRGLIKMDAIQTFELLEDHFDNKHVVFIDSIQSFPKE